GRRWQNDHSVSSRTWRVDRFGFGLAAKTLSSRIRKPDKVLPRRRVVERTFAWLGRCRRLAMDFENLSREGLAFLKLASIRLMLRRLCSN
ncbi:hypothetical protein ACK8OU_20510, partial [Defluviimonas sp. KMU-169]